MIKPTNKLTSKLLPWVAIVALLLSGCTTTTTGTLGEKDPEAARDAYIQLGVEYLRIDDRENAKVRFLKALDLDPDSAAAYTGLALIYERSHEYEAAEDFFKKALRANNGFTQAQTQYGLFLLNQNRYRDACRMLDRASSDVLASQRHIAMYYLGKCEIARGRYAEAAEILGLSTRINDRFASSWSELALAQYHLGDFQRAKTSLNQFRRNARETAATLLLEIKIALAEGDFEAADHAAKELEIKFPASQELLEYQQMSAL